VRSFDHASSKLWRSNISRNTLKSITFSSKKRRIRSRSLGRPTLSAVATVCSAVRVLALSGAESSNSISTSTALSSLSASSSLATGRNCTGQPSITMPSFLCSVYPCIQGRGDRNTGFQGKDCARPILKVFKRNQNIQIFGDCRFDVIECGNRSSDRVFLNDSIGDHFVDHSKGIFQVVHTLEADLTRGQGRPAASRENPGAVAAVPVPNHDSPDAGVPQGPVAARIWPGLQSRTRSANLGRAANRARP
jgi:hypothetical protein